MNEIEEIKQRLDIVELAKSYMTLRQAGRNFKAICPLHNEKTPSLMVSADKQIWHCFGCGAGGDVFALVQKMEGVDFYESLKILAEKAGVELKQTPGYKKFQQETEKLTDINSLAAEFYHQALKMSKAGVVARQYIEKRGLTLLTLEKFKIGYAPDLWDALANFLKKRGKSETEMLAAGLVSRTKKNTVVDRFRQRLMFPIWDQNGRIVGFTGRVLREADNPKYLNTAATKLFDKSKIWYGLNLAKEKIKNKNEVIVCEGQMDVIACYQAGYDYSVCSSGTAVSVLQLKLLKRWTENLVLAFDQDQAGLLAGYRLTGMALAAGFKVRIVDLDKYKDPDEMIKADEKKWADNLKEAKNFVDFYLEALARDSKEVKQKQDLADKIIPLIDQVEDEVGRGYYLNWLADKLGVDARFVLEKYEKWQKKNDDEQKKKPDKTKENPEPVIDLANPRLRLLGLFLAFWKNLQAERRYLPLDITSGKIKEIVVYLQAKKEGSLFDWDELGRFDAEEVDMLRQLVMLIEKEYQDLDEELILNEVKMLQARIEVIGFEHKKDDLENMILDAEKAGDREKVKEYIRSLQDLIIKSN